MHTKKVLLVLLLLSARAASSLAGEAGEDSETAILANEVRELGWIVFAAHPKEIDGKRALDPTKRGPLDLYLARPDGTGLRNVTGTSEYSEYGARFSPDGTRLLYRRVAAETRVNHDLWGAAGELVICEPGGSRPIIHGKDGEYPWACWSPDCKRISCLYATEGKIRIHDLETKEVLRELDSHDVYQQLFWSPDGKTFCGTANFVGMRWSVISIDIETGEHTLLTRQLNCTPDWFQKDAGRVIYSHRNPLLGMRDPSGQNPYGSTVLLQVQLGGVKRRLVYGHGGRHSYFGCLSPDDRYVIFAYDPEDTIVVGDLRLVRLSDTPILQEFEDMKVLYPDAKDGPVLELTLPGGGPLRGFEPHWTFADLGARSE
jgi:hypothetical protein